MLVYPPAVTALALGDSDSSTLCGLELSVLAIGIILICKIFNICHCLIFINCIAGFGVILVKGYPIHDSITRESFGGVDKIECYFDIVKVIELLAGLFKHIRCYGRLFIAICL